MQKPAYGSVGMKKFTHWMVLCLLFAAPLSANLEFHLRLLDRGRTSYAAGNYQKAAEELELASFGFLENLADYETAQVYLALTYQALGRSRDAALAVQNVLRAEDIAPTYRTLNLDPAVQRTFEQVFARLAPNRTVPDRTAPPQAMRETAPPPPAPATGSGKPVTAATPAPVPTSPAPIAASPASEPQKVETPATAADEPAPAPAKPSAEPAAPAPEPVREIDSLRQLLAKDPGSVPLKLALTEASIREGLLGDAKRYAESVLTSEPSNAMAHVYLGRIAARERQWKDASTHFRAAQALLPLSDEDQASLFVCYVNAGDYPAAMELEGRLPESSRQRNDVSGALDELDRRSQYDQHSIESSPPPPAEPPGESLSKVTVPAPAASTPAPPRPLPSVLTEGEIFSLVREARDLSAADQCAGAGDIYLRILGQPTLPRYVLMAVGRGLNRCRFFNQSQDAYDRASPLEKGEERDMFSVAVNQFELGNFSLAREYLRRSIDSIEQTPEVKYYRSRIESGR